jgi:FMN reductase
MTRIVGIVGGPEAGGRTSTAVAAVLAGAPDADTELIELSRTTHDAVAEAMTYADAVVVGSPVYRTTYSSLVKATLERTERGKWGEKSAPLQGKAAAIVLTGAGPTTSSPSTTCAACSPASSPSRSSRPASTSTTRRTSTARP